MKKKLYKLVFEPVITYGAEIWDISSVSGTNVWQQK